jgi:hypothetical protein
MKIGITQNLSGANNLANNEVEFKNPPFWGIFCAKISWLQTNK